MPGRFSRQRWRYIFGPVPSRRFGRSLGIDPFPRKICTLDCVFCEVGRTEVMTLNRGEYSPVEEILAEFRSWLNTGESVDVVTLAGSGEPTLHTHFGDILRGIREACSLRTVLLSNGSLFYLPEVRSAAAVADVVKVTLSAWDQRSFEALHRPHAGLKFEDSVYGLAACRSQYRGEFCVEVFVAAGFNDRLEDGRKIASLVNRLGADRVHLNTLFRPGVGRDVRGVDEEVLRAMADLFRPRGELPRGYCGGAAGTMWDDQRILAVLARRPCSAADMAALTGKPEAEILERLAILEGKGLVRRSGTGDCWICQ